MRFSMMTTPVFLPFALNLLLIAALPKLFFRQDGRFNLMWFVTAGPFILCGIVLTLCTFGWLSSVLAAESWAAPIASSIGSVMATASIALIALTLGTHRRPLALWHQENDAPQSIVTEGVYSHVRHPFYAAFLLCLLGAVIAFPHPGTAAAFVYGLLILNMTAAREEQRLLRSEFGENYRAYLARTRRFLPRLGSSLS
jgi:protein-S-isoprenylcysteine O-methyltransferase Ste14